MTLQQALGAVAGRPDLFLVRPTGEILRVTKAFGVRDVRNGKPRQWCPSYGALVTDDWQVMDAAKLQKMLGAGQEAGAA